MQTSPSPLANSVMKKFEHLPSLYISCILFCLAVGSGFAKTPSVPGAISSETELPSNTRSTADSTVSSSTLANLPPPLQLTSAVGLDGRVVLKLTGPTGASIFLESSSDLLNWEPLHYDVLTSAGIAFPVNSRSGPERHFFRARLGESALQLTAPASGKVGIFSLVRIEGTGLDPTAETSVRFTTDSGESVIVPCANLSSTVVGVSVPFITFPAQSEVPVGLQVIQKKNGATMISRTLSGLRIEAPPQLSLPPGSVTISLLKAVASVAAENQHSITGTTWENAQVSESLSRHVSVLQGLIPAVEGLAADANRTFSVGSLDGREIIVRQSDLSTSDRLLVNWLQALAQGGEISRQGSLTTSTGSCLGTAAGTTAEIIISGDRQYDQAMGLVLRARQDTLCAIPDAFSTSFLVVGGSAGVAIGAPLLAFGQAAVGAVALPTAALLAITLELSAGQIALGGALSQTTDAAQKLVQDGIKRIEDLKWAPVKLLLPERLTGLISIVLGQQSLQEAVSTSPLKPFYKLTISKDGTGDGNITIDPPGLSYPEGTKVTLTASTNSVSAFEGWTAPCEGSTQCVLVMNSDVTIKASFRKVVYKCNECFGAWIAADNEAYRQYEAESALCTTGTLQEQLACVNAALATWQARTAANALAYEECQRNCVQ